MAQGHKVGMSAFRSLLISFKLTRIVKCSMSTAHRDERKILNFTIFAIFSSYGYGFDSTKKILDAPFKIGLLDELDLIRLF